MRWQREQAVVNYATMFMIIWILFSTCGNAVGIATLLLSIVSTPCKVATTWIASESRRSWTSFNTWATLSFLLARVKHTTYRAYDWLVSLCLNYYTAFIRILLHSLLRASGLLDM